MSFHSGDMETKSPLADQIVSTVKELSSDEPALAFTPQEQRAIVHRINRRLVVLSDVSIVSVCWTEPTSAPLRLQCG